MKLNELTTKAKVALTSVVTAISTGLMMVTPMLAAEGDIAHEINQGLKRVYMILLSIVGPIAVIAVAVCAIRMIWGNQQSAEQAKKDLIKIVVALALIFLAPWLVETVSQWFTGHSVNIWN